MQDSTGQPAGRPAVLPHLQGAVTSSRHPLTACDVRHCMLGHAGTAEHEMTLLWNLPDPAPHASAGHVGKHQTYADLHCCTAGGAWRPLHAENSSSSWHGDDVILPPLMKAADASHDVLVAGRSTGNMFKVIQMTT